MSWRVFLGVGLVVIGGGFLLDQMGVVDFGPILATWWPLILISAGAFMLLNRSRRVRWDRGPQLAVSGRGLQAELPHPVAAAASIRPD